MELDNSFTSDSPATNVSFNSSLNNSAIRERIIRGEFKISKVTGKSKVWELYGIVVSEANEQIPNIVACKTCFNIFKHCKKSTSNLLKHKCFINYSTSSYSKNINKVDISAERKQEVLEIITEWVIKNCRPYKIVEDSGLHKLLQYFAHLGVSYGQYIDVQSALPHPTTISRNIENIYDKYFNNVRAELGYCKFNGYGLTTDLWTDNFLRKTYLAVTVHYIRNGNIINRILGLRSMGEEKNTSINIHTKVSEILEEFNLGLDDKAIIVTDRGSNMVAAFRSHCHLFCVNHLLHNVIQKSIEETEDIAKLARSCAKLVKYFKKSGHNSSLRNTLKSFSPTRFNTIYYLLISIQRNWAEVLSILHQENNLHKISSIQLNNLDALIAILEYFEQASKKLEGEKHATIYLVHVLIHRLQKAFIVTITDSELIKEFKTKLCTFIQSTVIENLSIIHKIALFLFVPANKLLLFSELDKTSIKSECKRLMAEFTADASFTESDSTPSCSTENSLLFTDFVQTRQTLNVESKIIREIHKYESTDVEFYDDFDIVRWWDGHKSDFPILYKLSCRILATSASSAPSERVFSVARNIITEKRCSISCNDSAINKIMFLHSSID